MSRWREFLGRHLRRSSAVAQALALSALTFGVLLPVCCQGLLHSYYFLGFLHLEPMSEAALRDSLQHGQDALRFWQGRPAARALGPDPLDPDPELLVTVVTASRRQARDFHYLLQVMQRLSAIVSSCGGRRCAEVLLCDVEGGPGENEDAALLEPHFRVVRRHGRELQDRGEVNTFEREKRDYVFCLRKGWELVRAKNTVVLEDDALPRWDFLQVVRNLLSRRFSLDTLYVKLFHPERLQRYWNPEPYRLLEWVGLGVLCSSLLLLLLLPALPPRCWNLCPPAFSPSLPCFLFFTLYFMAAAELLGRHYLLEARRLSPQLYAVCPATECCTPAMLFPGNASLRAARYLDGSFCARGNAKDIVLYNMARSIPGERAHSVEPNLITHIGAYSSVRPNPARPKLL